MTAGLERRDPGVARASEGLAERLRTGLVDLALHELLDFGPRPPRGPLARMRPRRAATARGVSPTVDLAVIALDSSGALRAAANVVLAPGHPDGAIIGLDADLAARGVRWRRWRPGPVAGGADGAGRAGGADTRRSARDDLVPVAGDPPLDVVSPYPASLFKLLVAWQVLRLADRDALTLDEPYAFAPRGPGRHRPGTRPVADWLEDMLTWSDNRSTCALIKLLHDRDAMLALGEDLAALGLGTLQVNGTRPANGGRWLEGRIVMTALDTARLLWLVDGGTGTDEALWHASGRAVTAAELYADSRARLRGLLEQQGFNTILSTANWGARRRLGGDYPAPGIPHATHERWIDPADGTVAVQDTRWGEDVRESNARAEVRFAHKTGSTWGFSSDAGIVTSLPGSAPRRYVVALLSDLGYRDADPRFAGARRPPCLDPAIGVCFSERIARIGALVDRSVIALDEGAG